MDATKRKAEGVYYGGASPPRRKKDAITAAMIVGHQYELVRRIMSELPALDAKRSSTVCRLWKSAADAEMSMNPSRRRPELFRWEGEELSADSGRGLVQKEESFESERAFYEAEVPQLKSFHNRLESFVRGAMRIHPMAAVCFSVGPTRSQFSFLDSLKPYQEFHLNHPTVTEILPRGCPNIHLSAYGIVNGEAELENGCNPVRPAVAIMLLPKREKVRIIPFEVLEHKPWIEGEPFTVLNRVVTTNERLSGDDDVIKGVIVMSNSYQRTNTVKFLQTVYEVTNGNVAIGGSLGDLAKSSTGNNASQHLDETLDEFEAFMAEVEDETYSRSVGMLFTVPRGRYEDALSIYSIVIPPEAKGEAAVTWRLMKLRNCVSDDSVSCAFMFACCGRGKELHGSRDVEYKAFKRLFPSTPVVGLFGTGEIGNGYMDAGCEGDTKCLEDDVWHEYSTVFLFLAYKT